jgi:hypothetical protein
VSGVFDGFFFHDLLNISMRQIALKGIREAGSYPLADYRLLNGGWAHSDAVMISGQNIRSEESAMGAIMYVTLWLLFLN